MGVRSLFYFMGFLFGWFPLNGCTEWIFLIGCEFYVPIKVILLVYPISVSIEYILGVFLWYNMYMREVTNKYWMDVLFYAYLYDFQLLKQIALWMLYRIRICIIVVQQSRSTGTYYIFTFNFYSRAVITTQIV